MPLAVRNGRATRQGHQHEEYDGLHRFLSQPAVDIPPMPHPCNCHDLLGVINGVQDAVGSDSEPPQALTPLDLLAATGPWSLR